MLGKLATCSRLLGLEHDWRLDVFFCGTRGPKARNLDREAQSAPAIARQAGGNGVLRLFPAPNTASLGESVQIISAATVQLLLFREGVWWGKGNSILRRGKTSLTGPQTPKPPQLSLTRKAESDPLSFPNQALAD